VGRQIPIIKKIQIVLEADEDPDTSWIGEYTDKVEDWNVCRRCGRFVKDHTVTDEDGDECLELCGAINPRVFQYFKPYAGGENPENNEDDYRKYGLQDYNRMEAIVRGDVGFFGLSARAECRTPASRGVQTKDQRIQFLSSGGLWGIESDSESDHVMQIAKEELAELRYHLHDYGVDVSNFDDLSNQALRDFQEKFPL